MTFSYDTRTRLWDTLSPAVSPAGGPDDPGLKWGAMCYDPVNQEIVLFGGGHVDVGPQGEGHLGTWIYKPADNTWTKPNLSVEPVPRCLSPMVYDPANRVIVLFGGDHLDSLMSDTWVYDCDARAWIKKSPAVSPSPRGGHAIVYLPKSGKVVLLGGFEYTSCTGYVCSQYRQIDPFQMWTYDPAADTWQLICAIDQDITVPNISAEGPRSPMVACDTSDRILALADDWSGRYYYNVETYSFQCDPSQIDISGTSTYGVSGGITARRTGPHDPDWFEQDLPAADTTANRTFLEGLPLKTWVDIKVPKLPRVNRDWGTTIYDPFHDQILKWSGGHSAHPGTDVPQYNPKENRWHMGYAGEFYLEHCYSNGGLGYYSLSGRPYMPGHTYHAYEMDVNLKKMVYLYRTYTYFYDPVKMDWETERVPIHPDMAPSTPVHHLGVFSTAHGAFCYIASPNNSHGFNPYLFNSQTMAWDKLPMQGDTPYYYADAVGMCYERKRDRMIVTSVRSLDTAALWTYEFSSHTMARKNPANTHLALTANFQNKTSFIRECVYLPTQDKIFYATMVNGANLLYDCAANAWDTVRILRNPGDTITDASLADWSTGLMYDCNRNLLWLSNTNCRVYVMRFDTLGQVCSTGVDKHEAAVSTSLKMTSFYPNPFSPLNTVSIWLTKPSEFVLTAYGLNGKVVSRMDTGRIRSGMTQIVWKGSQSLAAGVYILKLKAGNAVQVHKIVLIK
jgi:hypothetical protein